MSIRILAVIPARGGSKGIPRKNLRLLNGRPLIHYVINTLKSSRYVTDIAISSEDDEILEVARVYGVMTVKRPMALAGDEVPLDPVVHHAVETLESSSGNKYDIVITVQPTSPLLSHETLDQAIGVLLNNEQYDTVVSAVAFRHLMWRHSKDGYTPMYTERKNRQYLEPYYVETGAFLITRRDFVKPDTRIGTSVNIFIVPEHEAVDIDTPADWWVAENSMRKMTVAFRVDGSRKVGLGHVYRALTLANALSLYHDVYFIMRSDMPLGIEKVKESGYKIVEVSSNADVPGAIEKQPANIVINDILDTDAGYMKSLKSAGVFVVNFEDLGAGADMADIVFNALYENSNPPENHYYGYRFVCLRDEFYYVPVKSNIEHDVKRILVTFGGTDPNNLTRRTLEAVRASEFKDVEFRVILGLGYAWKDELQSLVDAMRAEGYKITIMENVKFMAREISEADMVITSNGRTIYEVASIGTPCISISQNEREARHLFVFSSKCIEYLGMAYSVSDRDIADAIVGLANGPEKRRTMNERCLSYDIRGGLYRVIKIIYDTYLSANSGSGAV